MTNAYLDRGTSPAPHRRVLLANGLVLGSLLLSGMLALAAGVPLTLLTRDPVASMEAPVYLGAMSHVGILVWCAGAVASGAGYVLLRARRGFEAASRFFLASSLLLTILMVDDLFLLHEVVLPQIVGVPQKLIYAGYAGLVGAWLLAFRRELRQGPWGLLALALACLGCSVGIDIVADRMHLTMAGYTFVEDGLKLAGILNWVLVVALMAESRLRTLIGGTPDGAAPMGEVRPFDPERPARHPRAGRG